MFSTGLQSVMYPEVRRTKRRVSRMLGIFGGLEDEILPVIELAFIVLP